MGRDTPLPGLYLHVPFCGAKCPYCDFYSTTDRSLIPRWLKGVRKEATLYRQTFPTFDTLYLGGGTPSLLPAETVEDLITFLRHTFSFVSETEISLEINPDDVNPDKLRALLRAGVNRISLGVQSMNDPDLTLLRRKHTAAESLKALRTIREAGFLNVGVDLLYGLPGQKTDRWLEDLEKVLSFRPEHLSCYQLTFAHRTLFGVLKEKGKMRPLNEEEEADLFLSTSRFLQARGYVHYEISNFAREERYRCRHNLKYWRRVPYLGLGPSAHSFCGNRRWWNVRSVLRYCRDLEEGRLPVDGEEALTEEQIRLEWLSLGLRTKEGVELSLVGDPEGRAKDLTPWLENGWVTLSDGRLRPTLKGFLVADRLPLLLA